SQQPGLCLFVAALIGLGVIGVMVRDFAMVWQPVPESLLGRQAVAVGSGVLMIVLGLGLCFRPSRVWAVRILFVYLIAWAALKIPAVIVAPKMEAVYLGLGELTMLLSGGWTLLARLGEISEASALGFLSGERGVRMARILFAISVIPVGLSHIVYAEITAGDVPHWLPYRLGWGRFTRAGAIAGGVGVLFYLLPPNSGWGGEGPDALFPLLPCAPA